MKNYSEPWIPRGIYKITSSNNKVQFWALSFSCFATIFTFWMGIAYQYILIDFNSNEAKNDAHMTVVENNAYYKSIFNKNDKCSSLLTNMLIAGGSCSLGDSQTSQKIIQKMVGSDWDVIMDYLKYSIEVSEKAKYYFDEEKYDTITKNNTRIHYVVSYYQNIIKKGESSTFDDFGYILRNRGKDTIVSSKIETDLVKFGNEHITAQQSLINSANGGSSILMGDKVMGTWSAMEVIYNNKKQKGQFITQSETDLLYKTRYNLLVDLGPLLAENFRIINDEVTPIRESELDDTNYLFSGDNLKNIRVSPGVIRTILFFIIRVIIGVIAWWMVIKMVFAKAEDDNPNSQEEWEKMKSLKNELAITEILIELYTPKGSN